MSNHIEIKIEGPRLTPDKLQKAVDKFVALIKGVTKNATGDYSNENWTMEVNSGSAVFVAKSDSRENDLAVDGIARGFRSLMSGIQSIPQYFTKDEVEAARDIANLIDDDGRCVNAIFIRNGGSPISLTSNVVKTANQILAGDKQIAFGSIEGMIESLHRKENQPITGTIKDPVHGRSVSCTFTKPEIEEEAFQAFRLARRVLAYGLIYYSKEGYPIRVDADIVRIFPPESELPTLDEIHAFFK